MKAILNTLFSARLRALLSLGMVLGLGAVGTLAAWSTSATTTSGVFTTAVVDIQLNGNQGNPTAYPVTFTTPRALLPGQSVSAILPVQNKGKIPFTYTASAIGVGTLGSSLQLTARYGAGATVSAINTCTGGTAIPTTAGSLGTAFAFGGTRGPLSANTGVDNVCLQFTLPLSAPNSLQSATGTVSLTFLATSS